MGSLTNKRHEKFCREYLKNGRNATTAYAVVYPKSSIDTARVNGSRLLTYAEVKARIAELDDKVTEKVITDTADIRKQIIDELAKAALSEVPPDDPVSWNEKLRALNIMAQCYGMLDHGMGESEININVNIDKPPPESRDEWLARRRTEIETGR